MPFCPILELEGLELENRELENRELENRELENRELENRDLGSREPERPELEGHEPEAFRSKAAARSHLKGRLFGGSPRQSMRAFSVVMLLALAMALRSGHAQVIRIGAVKPRPQLTLGDTLTVSATPSVVSITLVPKGTAVASSSISITTSSTGVSLFSSLALYAYFASASMALSGGTPVSYIPSSVIYGQCPTGTPTTYTSFTSTEPFGGASAGLQVYSQTSLLSLGAMRTDVLSLEINLSSLPQQPAAVYTGSLYLEAQAF